jgi:hypothetical protein
MQSIVRHPMPHDDDWRKRCCSVLRTILKYIVIKQL